MLPFVLFKANRILPGEARTLAEVLPVGMVEGCYATLALAAFVSLRMSHPLSRLFIALVGILIMSIAVATAASELTPAGDRVVRVAPGGAYWVLVISLGLLATDALSRLRLGPVARVACLAACPRRDLAALATGYFDDLSIMREYAMNAARFAREARQHVQLALGTLVRRRRRRPAARHAVSPRAAHAGRRARRAQRRADRSLDRAVRHPDGAAGRTGRRLARAGALGVSGIGAAPAAVALFLYSLLPIVGNTVVGLAARRAGRGRRGARHGITDGQVLRRVELPLALPTILAGIRIVLVQNIGLVTIAALIGGGGFGAFVFQGIGQTAIDLVLLGAMPTVAARLRRRRRPRRPSTELARAGCRDDHDRTASASTTARPIVVDDVSMIVETAHDHHDRRHLGVGQDRRCCG